MFRKVSWMGRAVCAAVVFGAVVSPASAEDVSFADVNLEAAVRGKLGIAAPTPVTDTDMLGLLSLDASDGSIQSLGGIEYAANLEVLWLYNNQISDIAPLAGLTNLYDLDLADNQISDIAPVAGLKNLAWLVLRNNQISDIAPVAGLTNLHELDLADNQISDLAPVAGLTNLWLLLLNNNQISDIAPLAGLTNLDWLWLNNNQISDIAPLAGLTNLYDLDLGGNQIQTLDLRGGDVSSLSYFTVDGNPLENVLLSDVTFSQTGFDALLGPIAAAPGVLTLDLRGVDFAAVADLTALRGLNDLWKLTLANAANLPGDRVVTLTEELDSLNWLDVTGVWDDFDAASQAALLAWDAIPDNTLIGHLHPGDANGDGRVDSEDFIILKQNFGRTTGATWAMGDFNGDGAVDLDDFVILKQNFGWVAPDEPDEVILDCGDGVEMRLVRIPAGTFMPQIRGRRIPQIPNPGTSHPKSGDVA